MGLFALPSELQGSLGTFQRLITGVLTALLLKSDLVYIDDILVYSKDFQFHLQNIHMIFDCLRKANLKLHPLKCCFAVQKLNYLEYHLSSNLSPDPNKMEAINMFSRLKKTPRNLKSFVAWPAFINVL